jgi:hypothetical protein
VTDLCIGQPAPLLSAEIDLRDFSFMPLDVVRLRDSDLTIIASDAEFRAAVLLWCASWHQVPAASLPDDDRLLAALAGLGRGDAALSAWLAVRHGALRGFVKCADGRLYHRVIAEKAVEAWSEKQAFRERKRAFSDRQSSRARSRWDKAKSQEDDNHPAASSHLGKDTVTRPIAECQDEIAADALADAVAMRAAYAAEMPMKVTGTGTGTVKEKNTPSSPAATVPVDLPLDATTTAKVIRIDGGKRIAYPDAFSRFWSIYPRQTHKIAALRAWQRAVKLAGDGQDGVARIEQAAEAFRSARSGADPRFVPHPATWLNAGAWDDPEPSAGAFGGAARPGYVPMGNV